MLALVKSPIINPVTKDKKMLKKENKEFYDLKHNHFLITELYWNKNDEMPFLFLQ